MFSLIQTKRKSQALSKGPWHSYRPAQDHQEVPVYLLGALAKPFDKGSLRRGELEQYLDRSSAPPPCADTGAGYCESKESGSTAVQCRLSSEGLKQSLGGLAEENKKIAGG